MSISEFKEKINKEIVIFVILLILIGFLSFGIGRLSALDSSNRGVVFERDLITDNCPEFVNNSSSVMSEEVGESEGVKEGIVSDTSLYVGSKNSNKYHYPWCSGAQRIKEENKVWFKSLEEAEAAGYEPAGNCPGL